MYQIRSSAHALSVCIFGRLSHPSPRCHLFNIPRVSSLVLISVRISNLLHPLPFCALFPFLLPRFLLSRFPRFSSVRSFPSCALPLASLEHFGALQNNADAIGNLITRWLKAALLSANPFRSRIQLSSLKSRFARTPCLRRLSEIKR